MQRPQYIAEGTSGVVMTVPGDDKRVIKEIFVSPEEGIDLDVLRELYALTLPDHPDLVRLAKGTMVRDNLINIGLPRALFDLGSKSETLGQDLTLGQLGSIFYQIFCALHVLHSNGLIHYDIKPQNVLVFDWPSVGEKNKVPDIKLSDYGLINFIKAPSHRGPNVLVSPLYRPPEQYCKIGKIEKDFTLDPAADIYSAGMMMSQLLESWALGKSPEAKFMPCSGGVGCERQVAEYLANILSADKDVWKEQCGDPTYKKINAKYLWDQEKEEKKAQKRKADPLWVALNAVATSALSFDKKKRPTADQLMKVLHQVLKKYSPELSLSCPELKVPEFSRLLNAADKGVIDLVSADNDIELMHVLGLLSLDFNPYLPVEKKKLTGLGLSPLDADRVTEFQAMMTHIPSIIKDLNVPERMQGAAALALASWIPRLDGTSLKWWTTVADKLDESYPLFFPQTSDLTNFYEWLSKQR